MPTPEIRRLPPWLRNASVLGSPTHDVRRLLRRHGLSSVCEEARCPNLGECFSNRTASFLILGDRCTRRCRFCAVGWAPPLAPDASEPRAAAAAVVEMGLEYVVVTSVTRDDLDDGGASHFAAVVEEIRKSSPSSRIEVLTPDFKGDADALDRVLDSGPDVFNHNVETVRRLYPEVRPQADYDRSLAVLRRASLHPSRARVKSGLMVGLGEMRSEVEDTLKDLAGAGCSIVTVGQYLRPALGNLPVASYVAPEEFEEYARAGLRIGIAEVVAGPLVRSSYAAHRAFEAVSHNRVS